MLALPSHRVRRAFVAGTVLVVWLLVTACGGGSSAPAAIGAVTEQSSASGLYRVRYRSDAEPIPLNEVHSWTLHVEDAAGAAVDGAMVTVDGGMPEHNHGMPTRPDVGAHLGDGDYRVEGMKFQMPGRWVITVTVRSALGDDQANFNLLLP